MPLTPGQFQGLVAARGWAVAEAAAIASGGILPAEIDVSGDVVFTSQTEFIDADEFYNDEYNGPTVMPGDDFVFPISQPTPVAGFPVAVPTPPVLTVPPLAAIEGGDTGGGAGGLLGVGTGGGLPGVGAAAVPIVAAGAALAAARQLLRLALGGTTRITTRVWNQLPGWAQTALAAVGITVGVEMALDAVPGDALGPGLIPGFGLPDGAGFPTIGTLTGVQVVGSWRANGVTFYRLSDGRFAVQNSKGRWKVWRPKKPIVLYADGASSLKTMLKADTALNKQSKKLAKMLNRRAPRRRSSTKADGDATTITQLK